MKERIKTILAITGGLMLMFLGILFIWTQSPDYSTRGDIVVVQSNTAGFVLQRDKTFFMSRPTTKVLYRDATGTWKTFDFPSEIVTPYTRAMSIPPIIEK